MNGESTFRRLLNVALLSLCTLALVVGVLAFMSDEVGAEPTAVTISGPIITDTVWTAVDSPYLLTDTVTITPGVTLTIEPGVMVMADGNSFTALVVENGASLIAIGTPTGPITFTSVADSAPGEWAGILLRGGGHFEHTTYRFGTYNIDIEGPTGDLVSIENSTIQNGSDYGMFIKTDALHRQVMTDVAFINNVVNRVLIDDVGGGDNRLLQGNTKLSPQPGLDGYEIENVLEIPEGITLTVEPGVILMAGDEYTYLAVLEEGHLEAVGTITSPITMTSFVNGEAAGWYGIIFFGSGHLDHTVIQYAQPPIGLLGATGGSVRIENSTIRDGAGYGMDIEAIALHRLHMTNVTFIDNAINRIEIDIDDDDSNTLQGNATLSYQPGLEGYEVPRNYLIVPDGITLTVEPGATLMSGLEIWVDGYLEAVGTPTAPITFTSVEDSSPGEWCCIVIVEGGAHFENVVIRYATINLAIDGPGGQVIIQDSQLSGAEFYPLDMIVSDLPRLQMDNVLFKDNYWDRMDIDLERYAYSLSEDYTLSQQPGLEGYVIVADSGLFPPRLVISPGVTLTMEPGTTMFVSEDTFIDVEGHLQAVGTAVSPITFTTINTGSERWAGLVVTGSAELVHANVIESGGSGVDVRGGQVSAACSTFADNDGDGVSVAEDGSPLVTLYDSNIFNNDGAGVLNESGTELDGRYNWWGDASGPGGQGPGIGDEISGTIRYQPWLIAPSDCSVVERTIYLPLVVSERTTD